MGTLLMLDPAMLPLVCDPKLAAALVLLPVSAAKVVLGVKEVAEAVTNEKKTNKNAYESRCKS
jgi:hypothetical protein